MASYMRSRRSKRRLQLIESAGGKCVRCHFDKINELDFHHKDRTTKLFGLSGAGLDKSWSKIVDEFQKCDLLCYKCHLKETAKQWKNKELTSGNSKRHLPYIHGTMRCYQEEKCKCNSCRKAKQLYRNKQLSYDEVIP